MNGTHGNWYISECAITLFIKINMVASANGETWELVTRAKTVNTVVDNSFCTHLESATHLCRRRRTCQNKIVFDSMSDKSGMANIEQQHYIRTAREQMEHSGKVASNCIQTVL
jgi:hypothetical protein